MRPNAPLISVVIPTRDRADVLFSRALPSALAQSGPALEVIVVDDGSTDATAGRLAAFQDPRLRVLRHPEPLGLARSRNDGIGAVRGEWIAFLDDDDLWSPLKLKTQLESVSSTALFAYCSSINVGPMLEPLSADPAPPPEHLLAALLVSNVVPGGCSTVIARTEAVRHLGGFDATLSVAEDWDLWIRLAATGPAAATPEILVAKTVHPGNFVVRHDGACSPYRVFRRLERKHQGLRTDRRVRPDPVRYACWLIDCQHQAGRRGGVALAYLRGLGLCRGPSEIARLVAAGAGSQMRKLRLGRGKSIPGVAVPPWLANQR